MAIRLPDGTRMAPATLDERNGFLLTVYNRKRLWSPPAKAEDRNARGQRTVWMRYARAYVAVKSEPTVTKPKANKRSATKLILAKVGPFWYDCKCGRQTTDQRATKGMCSHGATFAGIDNGKGGNGGL